MPLAQRVRSDEALDRRRQTKAEEIVPQISEFANSQNKVNAADFFANHPFHVRMEEFSRRIYAPSPDGALRESKWFYERARGQYQDARGKLSTRATEEVRTRVPEEASVYEDGSCKVL